MKKETSLKKWKIIGISTILIIIAIVTYFSLKNANKNLNYGNNITNKSVEEIEEYILNISSYKAEIILEITSNKNTNRYKLIQKYASPNIFKQEVLEPNNIKGLTTTYDGTNLKIENTSIELSKIYENYNYIFCGDYLDRGLQNKEVLEFLISLKDKKNCVFLEGNHEKWLRIYSQKDYNMDYYENRPNIYKDPFVTKLISQLKDRQVTLEKKINKNKNMSEELSKLSVYSYSYLLEFFTIHSAVFVSR